MNIDVFMQHYAMYLIVIGVILFFVGYLMGRGAWLAIIGIILILFSYLGEYSSGMIWLFCILITGGVLISFRLAKTEQKLLEETQGTLDAIPVIPSVIPDNFSIKNTEVKDSLPKAVINAFGWKSENLAILIAKDDSMSPTIKDGDKVILDLSSIKINDNKVYAIKIGNDIYIRRIIKSPINNNMFTLIPDTVTYNGSKNYRGIELSENSFEIIGRVIMLKDVLI